MPEPETLRALELLHPHSQIIELRPIMPDGRWWSGLFDDKPRLVEVVEALNRIEATAVYWTINPISPSLASRVTNRLGPARKGGCIANRDIDRIRWLFLDIDNKGSRPAVHQLTKDVRDHLHTRGWAEPVFADSGNGCYLFYPVDLDPSQKGLVRKVVNSLAEQFNREGAIIDPKCVNPARIARVPGTWNRKSNPRLAHIVGAVA